MAKIDKSQYTKAEWKALKAERRAQKEKSRQEKIVTPETTVIEPSAPIQQTDKNYVLCLKHGDKYPAQYVNRLHNMVKRHCTVDYEFVCLTDNAKGLDKDIKIIPLPHGLTGWWCKPYMFSKDLPIQGTILYMDLDVVIASNIDKLFQYETNRWCVIRDFTRAMRPKWDRYNSSVVRFKTGELDFVWTEFEKDRAKIQRRLFGDQDWLFESTKTRKRAMFYPDSWIQSWKWEVRKTKEFQPGGAKGSKKFKHIEDVEPRVECCVCVFHGDPNPHNCEDPWVIRNWK